MARESVKILQGKLDVESLIAQLNAALAEEWLAYYQYWVGALVVEGAMRADVQGEFEEHAEEERRHAQLLADRIIELEGVPVYAFRLSVIILPFYFSRNDFFILAMSVR